MSFIRRAKLSAQNVPRAVVNKHLSGVKDIGYWAAASMSLPPIQRRPSVRPPGRSSVDSGGRSPLGNGKG